MTNTHAKPTDDLNTVVHALEERQEQIIAALAHTHRKPSLGLLEELAELGIALEDSIEVNYVSCDPHPS